MSVGSGGARKYAPDLKEPRFQCQGSRLLFPLLSFILLTPFQPGVGIKVVIIDTVMLILFTWTHIPDTVQCRL